MTRHIVITGLMGSGKSTIGAGVAAALGRPHRDSDTDLLARTGRTARTIAAEDGIDRLHELELAHLREALADPRPAVISTAASTIDDEAARAALRDPAIDVVWLRIDPATALARRRSNDHRPDPEAMTSQARRRDPLFADVADLVVEATAPRATIVEAVAGRHRG